MNRLIPLYLRRSVRALFMRSEHLTDAEIAGFLDNDLARGEREVIIAHMEGCAKCRAATADVSRMARAYLDSPPDKNQVPPALRRQHYYRSGVVLAMAAAASITVVILSRTDEPDGKGTPVRAGAEVMPDARPRIDVIAPVGDTPVTRPQLVFSWRATGADLYRITVFDDTGSPVIVRETPDTLVSLVGEKELVAGPLYLWRVDGIADGIVASSTVQKLRIAP